MPVALIDSDKTLSFIWLCWKNTHLIPSFSSSLLIFKALFVNASTFLASKQNLLVHFSSSQKRSEYRLLKEHFSQSKVENRAFSKSIDMLLILLTSSLLVIVVQLLQLSS